jgi:SAM-dependent methyltransferase
MNRDRPFDAFDRRAATYTAARIRQYNEANERRPEARETERRILIDALELRPGLAICDVAAGGGYLADGIWERLNGECRIICLENSAEFLDSLPDRYERLGCSLSAIALPDQAVDRVACLAGVHHQEDKIAFFREACRVLRPSGLAVVGDVLVGTATARFLNEAVDRWSDLGHDGKFLAPGELTILLEQAGFTDVSEGIHQYTWDFASLDELVWFCKTLFRMTRATLDQAAAELHRYLRIDSDDDGARLHWTLAFARGYRPS